MLLHIQVVEQILQFNFIDALLIFQGLSFQSDSLLANLPRWATQSLLQRLVHHFLEYYARNTPEAPCISESEVSLSYAELEAAANRLAHGFLDLGVEKGQRVAILGENSVEHSMLFMAASKVGAVSVPLNYRLAPAELAFVISDSNTRALLVLEGCELISP